MTSKTVEGALEAPPAPPARKPPGHPLRVRGSWAWIVVALIASLVAIRLAKPVLVPVVAAVLIRIALEPVMVRARRWRIPAPVAAVLIVALICGGLVFAVFRFADPVTEWMDRLPASIERVEAKLDELTRPLAKISTVADRVETVAEGDAPSEEPVKVEVAGRESLFRQLLFDATTGLVQVATVLALLLLLLAADGSFVRTVAGVMNTRRERGFVVDAVAAIEDQVGRYLGTVVLVNIGLGVAIGIGMALVGMPNPALWGTAAAILSFVPYVGGLVGLIAVTWVSMLTFDSLGRALLPTAVYLLVDACEGLVVTPLILGKRLETSPVVMFVWLALWGWLWGIPGAFMAVPMLAVLRIVCDHVPGLEVWAALLGRWSTGRARRAPA